MEAFRATLRTAGAHYKGVVPHLDEAAEQVQAACDAVDQASLDVPTWEARGLAVDARA